MTDEMAAGATSCEIVLFIRISRKPPSRVQWALVGATDVVAVSVQSIQSLREMADKPQSWHNRYDRIGVCAVPMKTGGRGAVHSV